MPNIRTSNLFVLSNAEYERLTGLEASRPGHTQNDEEVFTLLEQMGL